MHGRVKSAIRLLTSDLKGSRLPLDKAFTVTSGSDTVHNILREKHPASRLVIPSPLLPEETASQPTHPIMFESITGYLIQNIALRTEDTVDPSGLDAQEWR